MLAQLLGPTSGGWRDDAVDIRTNSALLSYSQHFAALERPLLCANGSGRGNEVPDECSSRDWGHGDGFGVEGVSEMCSVIQWLAEKETA